MGISTGPRARLAVFGEELIEIHRRLRSELSRLRADVDSYLAGHGDRPRDLKTHCVAFCSALTAHHTGEDAGAFPVLAETFPELQPIIAKLVEDHVLVSGILRRLTELLGAIGHEPDAAEAVRVRGELDGLAAILESHFSFEERRIVTALNSLPSDVVTLAGLLGELGEAWPSQDHDVSPRM